MVKRDKGGTAWTRDGASVPPLRIHSLQKNRAFLMRYITFNKARPLDLILLGQITID